MRARLIGIARHAEPRAPMESLSHARISCEAGIEGDFPGRAADRNVTIVSFEDWEAACRELGRDLPWQTRRANLLVQRLTDFKTVGTQLRVGSVRLEVTEECQPCSVMDKQSPGLRVALLPDWRGGVACRVLQNGEITVGDPIDVVDK